MAIEGRSPREAADEFCGILNSLLAQTITKTPLTVRHAPKDAREPIEVIAFRDRKGMACWDRMASRVAGRLRWFVAHECGFEHLGAHRFRLETVKYTYHLAREDADEPFLRWEYVKFPGEGKQWCRHHVQGPIEVTVGDQSFKLDRFHLPTGFVTMEEIVQFCLHDLQVKAITEDWYPIVDESYQRFASSLRKRSTS